LSFGAKKYWIPAFAGMIKTRDYSVALLLAMTYKPLFIRLSLLLVNSEFNPSGMP